MQPRLEDPPSFVVVKGEAPWRELAMFIASHHDQWVRFDPPAGADARASLQAQFQCRDGAKLEYRTEEGKHYARLLINHGPAMSDDGELLPGRLDPSTTPVSKKERGLA